MMKSQGTKKGYKRIMLIAIGAILCVLIGGLADLYADQLVKKYCSTVTVINLMWIEAGADPKLQAELKGVDKASQIEQIIDLINSEDFYFIAEPHHTGNRKEIGIYTADPSIYIYDVDNSVRILKDNGVISLKAKDKDFFAKIEAIIAK